MGGLISTINAYASAVDELRKAHIRAAAFDALVAIKEAAKSAMTYVSTLFDAATSSHSAAVVSASMQHAAGAAANKVVELVRELLGRDAAAAAMARFSAVVAALRCGASSFAATVVADLDAACSAAFPVSARQALAAARPPEEELAAGGKGAVSVVAEIRALVAIFPLVEQLLGMVVPWEVKAAIATLAVAAGLYQALCAKQGR